MHAVYAIIQYAFWAYLKYSPDALYFPASGDYFMIVGFGWIHCNI